MTTAYRTKAQEKRLLVSLCASTLAIAVGIVGMLLT